MRVPESLTGQFLSGTRRIEVPDEAPQAVRLRRDRGRDASTTSRTSTSRSRSASFCCGHRRVGLGQVHAGQRDPLQGGRQQAAPRRGCGRARTSACAGLEQLDKIIYVDQSPIGRTPRSNPATYIGLFDQIRDLFSKTQEARARGYKPGRFSFNVKGGRCEVCRGDGQIKIEMHFLPDVYVPCEQCHGKRYNRETLDIRFKGKTIADVLDMPIEEALEFFAHIPKIQPARCRRCTTSGSTTCGSASRPRRCPAARPSASSSRPSCARSRRAGRSTSSTSRPPACTSPTSSSCSRCCSAWSTQGNSVVVIEHNLDVIKTADRIIDMGPEGGEEGGNLMAAGTPEEVAAVEDSYTGRFLKDLTPAPKPKARKRAPRKVAAAA